MTDSDSSIPAPVQDPTEPPILFYCRDCKKLVDKPVRLGQHYIYQCPDCQGERVSFGSRHAVSEFYQVRP